MKCFQQCRAGRKGMSLRSLLRISISEFGFNSINPQDANLRTFRKPGSGRHIRETVCLRQRTKGMRCLRSSGANCSIGIDHNPHEMASIAGVGELFRQHARR